MTDDTMTLLPCPFCGAAARFFDNRPYWGVRCTECMSRGQLAGTRERAAELWNRRESAIAEGNVPDVAPVAWLHTVTQDDGETDQALSFSPDSFPFDGIAGYRSVSHMPLYAHATPKVTP